MSTGVRQGRFPLRHCSPRRRDGGRLAPRGVGLVIERFEDRRVLAAVSFAPQQIIDDPDADGAAALAVADLDADGDADVLVGSHRDGRVAWYENEGGGAFRQHLISQDATEVRQVLAADMDGDGDLDVAAAVYGADRVVWYENLDGQGSFDTPRNVTSQADGVRALAVADVDGDGDGDLVSASWFDNKLAWYPNDGQGNFGGQIVITTELNRPRSLQAGDINGDEQIDVIVTSRFNDAVYWLPNVGGGHFGQLEQLPTTSNGPESVELADVDGDGDLDAFLAFYWDGTITWLENTDGQGTFGAQQDVASTGQRGQSVVLADLDGDGDLDLVSASYYDSYDELANQVVWYPNTDGLGDFGAGRFISSDTAGVVALALADLDGDGQIDVLSASQIDNKVSWFPNTDGQGSFPQQKQVLSDTAGTGAVALGDVDGDGDLDVLAAGYWDNEIAWYENRGVDGETIAFAPQRIITTQARRAQAVTTADLDGDGDLDVLSASYRDNKIAWYENQDGAGGFGSQQIITNRVVGAVHVHTADLDGDGDLDVLSASASDGIVAWYPNIDGQGQFGAIQILTRQAAGAEWVSSADLDGDGDLDVLSASYLDGRIAWYQNTDGNGQFSSRKTISTELKPTTVEALDIDGDGDLDLVTTHYARDPTGALLWLEHRDGQGDFAPARIIAENLTYAEALFLADVDGNGTLDILTASDRHIVWYERAAHGFQQYVISSSVDRVFGVVAGDLDNDGDQDVVSASFLDSKLALYRNVGTSGDFDGDGKVDAVDIDLLGQAIRLGPFDQRMDLNQDGQLDRLDLDLLVENILQTTYGDANLDGIFNSQDFVKVFQAGEYEDGVAGNSTWAKGDWNGDGEFTSADMVVAFQKGGYVAAGRPVAVVAIGEPREIAAAVAAEDLKNRTQKQLISWLY